jgi:hypothetical protein
MEVGLCLVEAIQTSKSFHLMKYNSIGIIVQLIPLKIYEMKLRNPC